MNNYLFECLFSDNEVKIMGFFMRFDQRSICENVSTGATTQRSDEYEEHELYSRDKASHSSQ